MFQQIAYDPKILSGTRLSVEFILELFASGATKDEILKTYPQLTAAAVEESLKYAAQAANK